MTGPSSGDGEDGPPEYSRRQVAAGALGLCTAAVAGCAIPGPEVTETVDRTYDTDLPLVVRTRNGSVAVTGEDRDDVDLTVTKRSNYGRDQLDRITVSGGPSGDVFVVEAAFENNTRAGADVALRVPRGHPLDEAETSNGTIDATDVGGDPVLDTSNGRITAEGVAGFLEMESSNGSLEATELGGLEGADTSNGSIDTEVPAIRGNTRVSSSNGSIDVAVGDVDARLIASTSNGDVELDGLNLTDQTVSDDRVEGVLGDGGPTLRVETSNGRVTVSRL